MPRDRQRLTLESGPVLDLAEIIRRGAGRAGARIRAVYSFSKGEVLATELSLDEHGGTMELAFDGRRQSFKLTCRPRHFGGTAMVHHLPVDIAQSTGAVPTAGRPVVREPACMGPTKSGVCVTVSRSRGSSMAHQSKGESSPHRRCRPERVGSAAEAKMDALEHLRALGGKVRRG